MSVSGKDAILVLLCCSDTRGHSSVTWMAELKGHGTGLLGGLSPLCDESVLIFMISDALSQHNNSIPATSVETVLRSHVDSILYEFHRHLTHVIFL